MPEVPALGDRTLRFPNRLAIALIGALLALRFVYLFTHGVDSDEPQNLHVVYRWLKGDLPYLEQFDNHSPLLHWMFLPFAAVIGENPNIVALARLSLVPLSFGAVGLFYILCRRLFDLRVALWSVVLTLALADWSLKSIEFRPDILWMFLWFAALCLLVRPLWRSGPTTFFLAGLLLGASAAASVKTVFLLPALAIGWAGAWVLSRDFREWFPWPMILRCAIAGAAGMIVVPAIIAGYFASHGAFDEMLFCIYEINKDPFFNERSWIFFAGLPVVFALAAWLSRPGGIREAYRAAVFLAAGSYTLAIIGFSPYEALAKQTFLPAYPLLLAAACHAVFTIRLWRDWQVATIGSVACAGLVAAMIWSSPPWRDGHAQQRELLTAVLEDTAADEYVMDLKGETIFRKRPVYLSYVGPTTRKMDADELADPDPELLGDTVTAVAVERTSSFPDGMQDFLRDNYLSTTEGELRVAGKILKPSWENGQWIERTSVEIPGEYVVVEDGRVTAERTLREDEATSFTFPGREQRFLFWKSAWMRGLRPTRD